MREAIDAPRDGSAIILFFLSPRFSRFKCSRFHGLFNLRSLIRACLLGFRQLGERQQIGRPGLSGRQLDI